MTRLPHAAKTLMRQVRAERKRVTVHSVGDPDGFGVFRSIDFNPAATKWLFPLLEKINDPRIASLDADTGVVTFVSHTKADDRTEFPLLDAATVLREGVEEPAVPEA